jgi:hypothetical protein
MPPRGRPSRGRHLHSPRRSQPPPPPPAKYEHNLKPDQSQALNGSF